MLNCLLNCLWERKAGHLIENIIQNNIGNYKQSIISLIKKNPNIEISEEILIEQQETLLSDIVADVTNFMHGNPVSITTKYNIALISPGIVSEHFSGELMSMGILYSIVCYSMTGKAPKMSKAVRMNHVLYTYQEKVLVEINDELTDILPSE